MTGEQDQVRVIAERIARRVSEKRNDAATPQARNGADLGTELSAVRETLDDLRQRLVQIESRLTPDDRDAISHSRSRERASAKPQSKTASSSSDNRRMSQLNSLYIPVAHPSQEKFGVEEATVAELVDFFEGDKKCDLEPGGKPCDHCAMCNSRGF